MEGNKYCRMENKYCRMEKFLPVILLVLLSGQRTIRSSQTLAWYGHCLYLFFLCDLALDVQIYFKLICQQRLSIKLICQQRLSIFLHILAKPWKCLCGFVCVHACTYACACVFFWPIFRLWLFQDFTYNWSVMLPADFSGYKWWWKPGRLLFKVSLFCKITNRIVVKANM